MEVPEGEKLGFVILQKDGAEVMLQSRASVKEGRRLQPPMRYSWRDRICISKWTASPMPWSVKGAEVLVPERTTFYGMREIWVREPGRNVLGFAART